MNKSKIQRDLLKMLKNVKKVGAKSMKSTVTLYIVLLLAVINLFVFINNQDNESLFLFLVISSLVYMRSSNMIPVLLIPLISVNVLIYLRGLVMSGCEGFSSKEVKMKLFVNFIEQNADEPSDNDDEGGEFYETFVKPVTTMKDLSPDGVKDMSVTDMKKIILLFKTLNDQSKNENVSNSEYIKGMVDAFKDKFDDSKTDDETDNESKKESFTFLEGYEDEDEEDVEDEDGDDYEEDGDDYEEDGEEVFEEDGEEVFEED